jgi:hypothetical protein
VGRALLSGETRSQKEDQPVLGVTWQRGKKLQEVSRSRLVEHREYIFLAANIRTPMHE